MKDTMSGSGQREREFIRQLPNGMILTAVSDAARQDWDPLLIIDELEKQWKEQTLWLKQCR